MSTQLGTIISGSLMEGFIMRINPHVQLEEIKTGKFVCVVGDQYKFFSLIMNLTLEVTNPDILLFPPSSQEKLLTTFLKQKDIYATASLKPMLMLNKEHQPMPIKTIPPHFAAVHEATKQDVALI